jgi:DNA mismatch endonuclease (patch repair protein)
MDTVSREKRSEIMSRIRSESGIERIPGFLRGLFLRRHPRGVFGRPDFANKERMIAVFIDGCFWHGHKGCYREPKSNRKFWREKIARNMERDRLVNRTLRSEGWEVIRIWECKLPRENMV